MESVRPPPPDTSEIDDVISRVEAIVADCLEQRSRNGFFAAMYLRMTRRVKEGILRGVFEDGSRMSHFDSVFAEHYFRAYAAWARKEPVPPPWKVAFDTSFKRCPIVLQHLFLGMNAHINFDLGLAVVETQAGHALDPLKSDYDEINLILALLLEEVQASINEFSPLLGILDFLGAGNDELLARFSIERARAGAWKFAEGLVAVSEQERTPLIARRRDRIAELADRLAKPQGLMRLGAGAIGLLERRDVRRIIEQLLEPA